MSKDSKKPKKAKRSDSEKRDLLSKVRQLIGANRTDEEIAQQLNLQPHVLAEYKSKILQFDRAFLENLDRYSAFSDYLLKMGFLIRELQQAVTICKRNNQGQALVAAIWRKKEAYDAILKWAQDFGFIERTAAELKLTSEFSFNTMSDKEVREEIEREVRKMEELVRARTTIRPEVADLMDEKLKSQLPSNVVVMPTEGVQEPSQKKKFRAKARLIFRTRSGS